MSRRYICILAMFRLSLAANAIGVLCVIYIYSHNVTTVFRAPVPCNCTERCAASKPKTRHGDEFYGVKELISSLEAFLPRDRIVTPLNFRFLLTSREICSSKRDPLILITVLSAHENEDRRSAIRRTWGRVARSQPWPHRHLYGDAKLVFLLGRHWNETLNQSVRQEAELERDIMVADFTDSYYNLTYKTLMGLKWMKTFCRGAKFVMKIDDDAFPDIPRTMGVVASTNLTNTIFGRFIFAERVIREEDSISYVSRSSYEPDWYPPHVKGVMYLIPNALALNILNVSEYFPYVNMEDVAITGILARPFNTRHLNIPEHLYDRAPEGPPDACVFALEERLVARDISSSLALRLWDQIERREMCETLKVTSSYEEVADAVGAWNKYL